MKHQSVIKVAEIITSVVMLVSLAAVPLLSSERLAALAAGLFSTAAIALIQFYVHHDEAENRLRLNALYFLDVVNDRGFNPKLWAALRRAKRRIYFMGNTGENLLNIRDKDSDGKTSAFEDRLERKVPIRVLVSEEKLRSAGATVLQAHNERSRDYPGLYIFRTYPQSPSQFILIVDDEVFFGPTFSHCQCMFTECLHFKTQSRIAKQYVKHFCIEWILQGGKSEELDITSADFPDNYPVEVWKQLTLNGGQPNCLTPNAAAN